MYVHRPAYQSKTDLLEQIEYYYIREICKVGGDWHSQANLLDEYTTSHNWHKKHSLGASRLKRSSLRHNLDLTYTQMNIFENVVHNFKCQEKV